MLSEKRATPWTEDETLAEPTAGCAAEDQTLLYDEEGSLVARQPIRELEPRRLFFPCPPSALDGSWIVYFKPRFPHIAATIRGPMRLEMGPERLRISGDVYVEWLRPWIPFPRGTVDPKPPADLEPKPAGSLVIGRNWYPAFPQDQYRWYFRSVGASYGRGRLFCRFERHLWDRRTEEFTRHDRGWMSLECSRFFRPGSILWGPQKMTGRGSVGGFDYDVVAYKTSPWYRGCVVEIDVMKNRRWPESAESCDGGQTYSFTGVFQEAGLDFRAVVNDIDVPEDPHLTIAELHTLQATHQSLVLPRDQWRLWLLVGSRMDGTLGLMFDTGMPPHREGAVGFYDPALPDLSIIHERARGKKLGEVELAFLRTLVHEAGHAFNLYHPKDDCHPVPTGTTIMNQTGDVMDFASPANPYPCNATMAFNEHNRTSLIHSPDPQVKPGWKQFGWGHGGAWCGLTSPVDALGLDDGSVEAEGLRLDLRLPAQACRGEAVIATVSIENVGEEPRTVSQALNLAEGDLRIRVTRPGGDVIEARDVVLACGPRRTVDLAPGESRAADVQLFYTAAGLTFDEPGRYRLEAELDVGDATHGLARSAPAEIVIRVDQTETERDLAELTLEADVGLSLALGDFGVKEEVRQKVEQVAERFGDTETGAAFAMVVVNSLAADLRDVHGRGIARKAEPKKAERALDRAMKDRDARRVAQLAAAVVSPRDVAAPLIDRVEKKLGAAKSGTYAKADLAAAKKILADRLV